MNERGGRGKSVDDYGPVIEICSSIIFTIVDVILLILVILITIIAFIVCATKFMYENEWIYVSKNGDQEYYLGAKLHREDGPALIYDNGAHKEWWVNGKRHRVDGPAVQHISGYEVWYIDGNKYDVNALLIRVNNPNYIPNEFEKLILEKLILE